MSIVITNITVRNGLESRQQPLGSACRSRELLLLPTPRTRATCAPPPSGHSTRWRHSQSTGLAACNSTSNWRRPGRNYRTLRLGETAVIRQRPAPVNVAMTAVPSARQLLSNFTKPLSTNDIHPQKHSDTQSSGSPATPRSPTAPACDPFLPLAALPNLALHLPYLPFPATSPKEHSQFLTSTRSLRGFE